jgi:porin
MKPTRTRSISAIALLGLSSLAHGYDVNDQLSGSATLFGSAQYGSFDHNVDEDGNTIGSQWGTAGGVDLEVDFVPTANDELYARGRYAKGNGLNNDWAGGLAPWGTDLHDDLTDINGSNRDYLLEAWYRHRFGFGDGKRSLSVTAGLIDAAAFLDDNAYADDEMVHFMNDAFVARAYMPAYDWGAGAELDLGRVGINAVYMNSKTGDDADKRFDYAGAQVHYHANHDIGEGTHRLWAQLTLNDFLDPNGEQLKSRRSVGVSIDQAVGEYYGLFFRSAWQVKKAAVDYKAAYTGGIHINGVLWGRSSDEAGFGIGYLPGGNGDITDTRVSEAYVRVNINRHIDVTADLQYMKDSLRDGGQDRKVWIPGLRLVVSF